MDGTRKENNSAIASWSGYIYQGLCAVYAALKLIMDKGKETVSDYYLFLDAYEDFSIHDAANKILSLHQCKVRKKGNYADDLKLMRMKRDNYIKERKCGKDVALYFHCNEEINGIGKDISMYTYSDEDKKADPYEISQKICSLVELLHKRANRATRTEYTNGLLLKLVDEKVLSIHNKYIVNDNNEKLYRIAKNIDNAIKFSVIIDILESPDDGNYCEELLWRKIRHRFILNLEDKYDAILEEYETEDEGNELNLTHAQHFVERLHDITHDALKEIVPRMMPSLPIENDEKSIGNLINNGVAEVILRVVAESKIKPGNELNWDVEDKWYTPAAFNSKMTSDICKRIINNKDSYKCMMEYDAFVNNEVKKTVDDIFQCVITKGIMDGVDDEHNIFKTKARSILTVNDFNKKLS